MRSGGKKSDINRDESSDTATESWGLSVVNLIFHGVGDEHEIFKRMRLV